MIHNDSDMGFDHSIEKVVPPSSFPLIHSTEWFNNRLLAHQYLIVTCAHGIFFFLQLQDALFKEHAGKSTELRQQTSTSILKQSCPTLREFRSKQVITIGYLEAVAGAKFAMMEIASLIYSQCNETGEARLDYSVKHSGIMMALIEIARTVCTDTLINPSITGHSDVTGPAVYLLKLLVRQFSYSCLEQASEKYPWIIPEGLRFSNLVNI